MPPSEYRWEAELRDQPYATTWTCWLPEYDKPVGIVRERTAGSEGHRVFDCEHLGGRQQHELVEPQRIWRHNRLIDAQEYLEAFDRTLAAIMMGSALNND